MLRHINRMRSHSRLCIKQPLDLAQVGCHRSQSGDISYCNPDRIESGSPEKSDLEEDALPVHGVNRQPAETHKGDGVEQRAEFTGGHRSEDVAKEIFLQSYGTPAQMDMEVKK